MIVQETSLYTYFDACGTLLYVGITSRGDQRQKDHALTQAWWPLVRSSRVMHYPTRTEARAVELEAIQRWKPPFNRGDNPDSWVAMIHYFMDRSLRELPDHEHDASETYTHCTNCRRCADASTEYNPDGLCYACDYLKLAAYAEGQKYGEERVLALGRAQGLELGEALAVAREQCPF